MKHALRIPGFIGGALLLPQLFFASHVSAQLPSTPPTHIVVLWEENYAYSEIIGSSNAPRINALAADTNAAVFTQFFAITHPSQPNYIEFFSGNDQGVTSDNTPASGTYPWTAPNLGAELINAGKTFTTYSEDLPSVGYDGSAYTAGGTNYARKHNPCTNWVFTSVADSTSPNQFPETVNQPFTAFPASANYSTLPTVSFVVPNMTNDMHDGSFPTNITLGDTWMYNNLDNLRAWSLTSNTLYIIIYDEDDDLHDNNIPVILYGPMVKGGTYTENVNFYNLLHTIETMYGLGHAGSSSTSTSITDCWKTVSSVNTGVNNVTNNSYSFKVMPNPASDVINFNCNTTLSSQVNITVSDATGRIAGKYTMTGSNLQVNTSAFATGVYSYNITGDNGNKLGEGKFVITHN